VFTTGIALYSTFVGVAEVVAGGVEVFRERKDGVVDVTLGEYRPPMLWVA